MRSFALFSASILVSIALSAPAIAEGAPDLSPLACAWGKLPDAEQTRLREEFKVELGDGGFTLHFGTATPSETMEAARACQLTLAAPQLEHLGLALSRHAAEERRAKASPTKAKNRIRSVWRSRKCTKASAR